MTDIIRHERTFDVNCIKCLMGVLHPWHDDGSENQHDIHEWQHRGVNGMPKRDKDN
jgi:hypothetical protein